MQWGNCVGPLSRASVMPNKAILPAGSLFWVRLDNDNQLLSKAMIDIPLRGWGITALLLIAKKLLHFVKKYLYIIYSAAASEGR